MSIYEILSALDLTQSVHAKISIGMHRGVKFKISRIPLIGLETRLGWRTDRKFLRNPNLNEIKRYLEHWLGTCYLIFSFMCMFCRSLFVLLSFFFWPCCCMSFFDLRILLTPLVSSNSSCINKCVQIRGFSISIEFWLFKSNWGLSKLLLYINIESRASLHI
jgi:hypothetical protein